MNASHPGRIRAFVAVYPDSVTRRRLELLQQQLGSRFPEGMRWTHREQLHLTLVFLGGIPADRVRQFISAAEDACSGIAPFTLRAEGLGCFPNAKRPRVLWVGIRGDVSPLHLLKDRLDRSLSQLGHQPEERSFHPHLTLARAGRISTWHAELLSQVVSADKETAFGEWRASQVDFVQSILSPQGATYRILQSFSLS